MGLSAAWPVHFRVQDRSPAVNTRAPREPMTDLLFILVTIAFFAISIAYARALDRT